VRIVLLTTGGYYGRWVAEGLRERGVPIHAVVLDVHRPKLGVALRKPRRIFGVPRRWLQAQPMRRFARMRVSANLNRPRGIALLRSLEPDLLVLGGARILSPETLTTARLGALNAHPARVPQFRGTGVVGWSILRGVAVEAVVHFAVPEVDAGPVVHSELVPVNPGESLNEIEARAIRMCTTELADVTARLWRGEELPRVQHEPSQEVFSWLDPEQRARCDELIEAGEAVRLYHEAAERG
jgi:folate-dependent phosphoribosylglycinamide formyltransferase PurN